MRFSANAIALMIAVASTYSFADGPRRVGSYRTPGGNHVLIDQVTSFPRALKSIESAGTDREGAAVLHETTRDGWRIASMARRGDLTIWQAKDQQVIRSVITPPSRRLLSSIVPRWWPALDSSWASRSTDVNSVTTTLLGWSSMSLERVESLLRRACAGNGLQLINVPSVSSPPRSLGDVILFFAGSNKELMATLSQFDHRVGVVAHLREAAR